MVSLNELAVLALGLVVSAGIGFLFWLLYHLGREAHSTRADRRSR